MSSPDPLSTNYTIRTAGPDDFPAVASLLAAHLREDPENPQSVDEEKISDSLGDGSTHDRFPREVLIVSETGGDNSVVACAVITPVFGLPQSALGLRSLVVAPAHRRLGLGRRLMNAIAARALELGCAQIEWQVPRLDLDPRAFFEIVAPDSFRLNELTYRISPDRIDPKS